MLSSSARSVPVTSAHLVRTPDNSPNRPVYRPYRALDVGLQPKIRVKRLAPAERRLPGAGSETAAIDGAPRSEEHTSELQSHLNLVCRLLLEKKKRNNAGTSSPRL